LRPDGMEFRNSCAISGTPQLIERLMTKHHAIPVVGQFENSLKESKRV
jgi:hypothetical protein